MACNLASNSTIDCLNSKGGVKIAYIGELADLNTYTVTSGAITAMDLAIGKKFWTYNLEKNNASYSESMKKNFDNGTKYYEGTFAFNTKKMAAATLLEFDVMAQTPLMLIYKDNNGKYFITGIENGGQLMTNDATSGKAFADLNGNTLSITFEEPAPIYEVSSVIVATLIVPSV